MKLKIIFLILFVSLSALSQTEQKEKLLDSVNAVREKDRGVFRLYIKKFKAEIISGVYRNRMGNNFDFQPFSLTYYVYLPFQFDLNYLHQPAKEKLLKINAVFVVHHSNYGNYVLGLSARSSFLIFKHAYLSYQIGVVWCEVISKNAPDGITNMGFSLHHNFAFSYAITKHFEFSLNVIHISNGALFKSVDNVQDVIGIGVSYSN